MRICKLRVFFITYSFQTIIVITSYLKRRKKCTYFIIFTPRLLNLKNLIICMHHTKCAGMHKTVIFYWVVFWSVCLFAYLHHFISLYYVKFGWRRQWEGMTMMILSKWWSFSFITNLIMHMTWSRMLKS